MNMKEKLPATLPNTLLFFWWLFSKPLRMFYFYTNELHFAPEFLGRSQLVGSLASLAPGMDEKPKRHEQPRHEISIRSLGFFLRNNQQEAILQTTNTFCRKHLSRNSADFPEV